MATGKASSIVFLGVAEDVRRKLQALAPSSCSTLAVGTVDEVERALASLSEPCVVISLRRMQETSFVEHLDRLRRGFAHAAILAVSESRAPSRDAILKLGGLGVCKVLTLDARLSPSDFRDAISHGSKDLLVQRIWRASSRMPPEPFGTIMQTMLRYAHEPLSTKRMAAIVGMHERTFRRYCETHGLPSPQWIAGWARLLIAAHHLEETGRSTNEVCALLQFSSPRALSSQLQRYTRLTLRALRGAGATRVVFEAMIDAVLASCPTVSAAMGYRLPTQAHRRLRLI